MFFHLCFFHKNQFSDFKGTFFCHAMFWGPKTNISQDRKSQLRISSTSHAVGKRSSLFFRIWCDFYKYSISLQGFIICCYSLTCFEKCFFSICENYDSIHNTFWAGKNYGIRYGESRISMFN